MRVDTVDDIIECDRRMAEKDDPQRVEVYA